MSVSAIDFLAALQDRENPEQRSEQMIGKACEQEAKRKPHDADDLPVEVPDSRALAVIEVYYIREVAGSSPAAPIG
jgi:hypothetical protein